MQSSLADCNIKYFAFARDSLGIGCVFILLGALALKTKIPEAPERARY